MRSEYVADMQALYFRLLPNGIGATYRLDILNGEQARDAIRNPAHVQGVTFNDAACEKLVRDLSASQGAVPEKDAGTDGLPLGDLLVEPVYLQVVCYRLWERLWVEKVLKPDLQEIQEVTVAHVEKYAKVSDALAGYYADKILAAAQLGVSERDIRVWCEQRLITRDGKRVIVQEGQDPETDLDSRAVQALVNAFLVRRDKKGVLTWLELSHDRLIEPIRTNNEQWFSDHLERWQQQALQWVRKNRADSILLGGAALAEAQSWSAAYPGRTNATDRAFLAASLNAATTQERLLSYVFRWWAYIGSGTCGLLVVLVVTLYFQVTSEREARKQATLSAINERQQRLLTSQAQQETTRVTTTLQQVQPTRRKQRPLQPGLSIGSWPPKDLPRLGACAVGLGGSPSGSGPLGAATAFFSGGSPTVPPAPGAGVVITAFVRKKAPIDAPPQRQPSNKIYLLTVPMVVGEESPAKGSMLYQPSWLDEQTDNQKNQIAVVSAVIDVDSDAPNPAVGMIAELLPEITLKKQWEPTIFGFGEIKGTGETQLGQNVLTVARSTVAGYGKVVSVGGRARIKGLSNTGDLELQDVIGIAGAGSAKKFTESGDGGAPVFTADGKLIGVVVGWNDKITYALPIGPILEEFNVELVPPTPPAAQKK